MLSACFAVSMKVPEESAIAFSERLWDDVLIAVL
jgi:hypothetical protein